MSPMPTVEPPKLGSCGCGAPWIEVLEGETTCVGYFSPPPEPDGRVHYHDGNRVGMGVKCANGHRLGTSNARYACWCGWSARALEEDEHLRARKHSDALTWIEHHVVQAELDNPGRTNLGGVALVARALGGGE